MTINRRQARPLCTDTEYALFTASLADAIGELTLAELRNKAQRARRARDKNRDLEKRQRLANRSRTRTKKGDRNATNARTAAKAQLFDEALARFETRAAKLTAAAEREARRKAAAKALAAQQKERNRAAASRTKGLVKGKTAARGQAVQSGYTSESARVAAQSKHARDTRASAVKGHQSAAGKRSQARRDARR